VYPTERVYPVSRTKLVLADATMAVVVFSVVALIITAANLWWQCSLPIGAAPVLSGLAIVNQLIAAAFGGLGFFRFRGRRMRPNYEIGKPPIWTLPRVFTVIALIASVGAILMPLAQFIGWE